MIEKYEEAGFQVQPAAVPRKKPQVTRCST